jgi:simple sugar transport system ATP-binding protein
LGRGAVPEMSLADNSLLTGHRQGMLRGGFIKRQVERAFTRRCIDEFDVRTPGPDAEAGAMPQPVRCTACTKEGGLESCCCCF